MRAMVLIESRARNKIYRQAVRNGTANPLDMYYNFLFLVFTFYLCTYVKSMLETTKNFVRMAGRRNHNFKKSMPDKFLSMLLIFGK